jgi:predicted metal-dependent RNase
MQKIFIFTPNAYKSEKESVLDKVQSFIGTTGNIVSVRFSTFNGDCIIVAQKPDLPNKNPLD